MRRPRWLVSILLGLPGLSWGYAYTIAASDGSFQQDATSGEPVVWADPIQSIALNFGGSPGFDGNAAAGAAMDEWNAVNTALQYRQAVASTACVSGDNNNSAGWGSVTCDGDAFGDALAITKRSYIQVGGVWHLREADIVVDRNRAWAVYNGPLRRSAVDFHRVILHELGHALGLDHPDQATPKQAVAAIMNSHTGNVDSLQDDDRKGVIKLYGGTSSNSAAQSGSTPSGGGGGGGADLALLGMPWLGRRRRRAARG